MTATADVFRAVESEAFFRRLAPDLSIGVWRARAFEPSASAGGGAPADRLEQGWTRWPGVVAPERAASMRAAIDALAVAGLPPVFAYVYDALWEPLDALAPLAAAALGPFDALADVWAWRVPREVGSRGWTPHRGVEELERGEDGRPVTLNVWIALTDVGPDEACMWIVPLPDDPDYPDALEGRRGEAAAIPLPAAPGDALAWNANALHWGGAMTERARGPRTSFSYTLRARGARRIAPRLPTPLDFRARLDLVAAMIVLYERQETVPAAVREWAAITRGLVGSFAR